MQLSNVDLCTLSTGRRLAKRRQCNNIYFSTKNTFNPPKFTDENFAFILGYDIVLLLIMHAKTYKKETYNIINPCLCPGNRTYIC